MSATVKTIKTGVLAISYLEYGPASGWPCIMGTGGHGDLNNYSPQTRVSMFPDERNFQIADDANQLRHVVRAQVKYGVDVIKILATGGVLSKGDNPGAPQFTYEELKGSGRHSSQDRT